MVFRSKLWLFLKKKLELQDEILNKNSNFILLLLRKGSFIFNIIILTEFFNNYLLIAVFIAYVINRIFWDIITTWYYVDILQGSIIYFEKKFVKYNFYKKLIILEQIIINYKKCVQILIEILNNYIELFNSNIKKKKNINYILTPVIFIYNIYRYLQSRLFNLNYIIKIVDNKHNFNFLIPINKTTNCNQTESTNLNMYKYVLYQSIYILKFNSMLIYLRVFSLKLIYYLNKFFNYYFKIFLYFKKFDDLNNKLIPKSTFETNLVISLAIVETNIYTFHIFNLTIAHNLDVYINNELGDDDLIEASIDDIGDWKECFDEYIEYKVIDITDPFILGIYFASKLLPKNVDNTVTYYCKNYELLVYDLVSILLNCSVSYLYKYLYKFQFIEFKVLYKRLCIGFSMLYVYLNKYKSLLNKYYLNIFNFNYALLVECINNLSAKVAIQYNLNVTNISIFFNKCNLLFSIHIKNIKCTLDYILLGLEIFYVNSKIPYKLMRHRLKLFLIKYLDYLEYCMLSHKFYYRRNIKKYFKKQYNPIKIKNDFEDDIKTHFNIFKLKLNSFIVNLNSYKFDFSIKITNYIFITCYYKYNFICYIETFIYFYIKEIQILYTNIIVYSYLIKVFYDLNSILSALILIDYPNNVIRDFKIIKSRNINIPIKKKLPNIKFSVLNYDLVFINNLIKKFMYIYSPIFLFNYILSDISLSFKFLFKKYKNIVKMIVILIKSTVWYIKEIILKIKEVIYFIINGIYSKTIYITFLSAYFFNRYFIDYLYFDFYLYYTLIFKNKYRYYISILEVFINWNSLIVVISLLGILLVLKWSRSVHRFFGYFFWTMIVFPIFLETHKTLYTKLFLSNYLNTDSIGFVMAIKLDLLNIFNYKLYNIIYIVTLIILLFIFFYTVKYGAFRHIYANLIAVRWKYIRYPIYIYTIEVLRMKLIELICISMLFLSCKYKFYIYAYYVGWKFNKNCFITEFINFINKYIIDFDNPELYHIFYTIFIPNPYIINIIIDLIMLSIALKWVLKYCMEFKKSDKKFVAFPLYVSEIFYKNIIIYYALYYLLLNLLVWISDGRLLWYGIQSLFILYLYLEIRVHKIPKKTMAWYFRQIVELWPLTCSMLWTTPKYLYFDQQKYLSMRQKLRVPKKNFKVLYNRAERWEKKIIFTFQRDKELELYKFTAFCRLMSRKENMLREFNIFDYQGWQEDWTFCYKKINIFNWKLDWWDKPYVYLFKKLIYMTNMKFSYFDHFPVMYRFSCKHTHLNGIRNIVKFIDYFYTNIFIFNFENNFKYNHLLGLIFRRKKYRLACIDWKLDAHSKFDAKEELIHLKKLKIVLMEFSCGLRDKTPDWVFPSDYEKQYKKDGWKMFEDSRIDAVPLDWRPKIRKW